MATKSALTKDPKVEKDSGKARALENYNKGIRMLKKYGEGHPRRAIAERLINSSGPLTGIKNWEKGLQTSAGANAIAPTPEQKFKNLSPEEQRKAITGEAGAFLEQNINRGQAFDPNRPFAGYEMGFGQARDKAYADVMGQFERTMQPEFERQTAQFQQRMADQGLDPASGAYQAQYKALADAQNNARLNAQSQASQQAYEVQKQAFEQGQTAANMPWQWQQISQPFITLPWEQAGQENIANIQGQQRLREQQIAGESARQVAGIGAGASTRNTQLNIEAEQERWRRQDIANMGQGQNQNQNGFRSGFQSTLPTGVTTGGMGGR